MSIIDSVKNAYENFEEGSPEDRAARGDKLAAIDQISYVGGYDTTTQPNEDSASGGTLSLYENAVVYESDHVNFTIPGEQVADVNVDGRNDVQSRVTVPRLAVLGLLALAVPKQTVTIESFVTLDLADGRQVVFHTTSIDPDSLRRDLANATSLYSQRAVSGPAAQATPGQAAPEDDVQAPAGDQ